MFFKTDALSVPAFAARLAFADGDELLSSAKAEPGRLKKADGSLASELSSALKAILVTVADT